MNRHGDKKTQRSDKQYQEMLKTEYKRDVDRWDTKKKTAMKTNKNQKLET